ncbi:UNVERIFIED_CONTAM: lipoprotein 17-related variable surface protein [Campylobacter lari]
MKKNIKYSLFLPPFISLCPIVMTSCQKNTENNTNEIELNANSINVQIKNKNIAEILPSSIKISDLMINNYDSNNYVIILESNKTLDNLGLRADDEKGILELSFLLVLQKDKNVFKKIVKQIHGFKTSINKMPESNNKINDENNNEETEKHDINNFPSFISPKNNILEKNRYPDYVDKLYKKVNPNIIFEEI